jgi:hypothetical protein
VETRLSSGVRENSSTPGPIEFDRGHAAGLAGRAVTAQAAIVIRNSPDAVWDFASDPDNWTVSNPGEHFGLRYDNPENRPRTGARFVQREKVAGMAGELRGRILYAKRPEVAVWIGAATYRLFAGLVRLRILEGGVLELEHHEGRTSLSHDVFMEFPDTLLGRLAFWWFRRLRNGEKAVYEHTDRELEFFKAALEKISEGER